MSKKNYTRKTLIKVWKGGNVPSTLANDVEKLNIPGKFKNSHKQPWNIADDEDTHNDTSHLGQQEVL